MLARPTELQSGPALFLDRDGTVMIDTGYPRRPDEVIVIREILPAIRAANAAGMPVVMVTNQSGIARGLLGWPNFAAVNARLVELLAAEGCTLSAVLACAYFRSSDPALDFADHPMRKPNPGMLLLAAERLAIDLGRSSIVGDRPGDIEAGARAGLSRGFLVGNDPGAVAVSMPYSRIVSAADWDGLTAAVSASALPR